LQAITPWDWDDGESDYSRVVEFAEELRREAHWEPTRESLRDWVDANPENHWWSYEEEIARWLNDNLGTRLGTDA
jgi:hypothetical protein